MPQKLPFPASEPYDPYFPEVPPEETGLSSRLIDDFFRQIAADPTLSLHTLSVYRQGKRIASTRFGDFRPDIWHITHSFSKSVTALAVGMLIGEGKLSLDDHVCKLLDKHLSPLSLLRLNQLTVRHLLTMSSGILFNEIGAVTETDWVKEILDSHVSFDIGRQFAYNSMNSYLLSAIVTEITGETLADYLTPRLFEPLSIGPWHWETCPKGLTKGGWGLYLLPRDMAKIGQLYWQEGVWEGKELVPASFIREATAKQIETPLSGGDFNYGYHVWVGRSRDSFLLNGMLGQNVLVLRDAGVMLVSTGSNAELFQQSNYFRIANACFPPDLSPSDTPLPGSPRDLKRLRREDSAFLTELPRVRSLSPDDGKKKKSRFGAWLCRQGRKAARFTFRKRKKLPRAALALDGVTYWVRPEKSRSTGLMPHMTEIVQNHYTSGLDSITFSVQDGVFSCRFTEGKQDHLLPIGFGTAEETDLCFGGEIYRVACRGEFGTDERDADVLRLRISFLEMSSMRGIRMVFEGSTASIELSETPGTDFLVESLDEVLEGLKGKPLLSSLTNRLEEDWLTYKIHSVFSTVLIADKAKP